MMLLVLTSPPPWCMFSAAIPPALISPEIPRLVNLLIFAGALYYLLRRPISQFFKRRAEDVRKELARAQAERENAQARLREAESKLMELDEGVRLIKARAEEEAAAEYDRIVRAAQAEAEKIRALAAREIEAARKAALLELRIYAVEKAVQMATQTVSSELNEEDHQRLVTQFIGELGEESR